MTQGFIIALARETLLTVIMVSAPMLGFGLVVGLAVSIFQTVTSIQDQTLSFVPKILAVLLSMILFGGWMIRTLMDFFIRLSNLLPTI
ncbi:MAG: flagellar biosynthesis protein FliQ [bacterium]|nr:flagellar biosynthesis protein FliQ [bacterium]